MKGKRLIVFLVLAVIAGGLQYAFWAGKNSVATLEETRSLIEVEQQRNVELSKRNDVLKAEVIDLQTDNETMEERARMELGLIKEGEVFYRIIETDKRPGPDN
ncbi:MAG: septum formation initiator family protein [Acidiferrobacterales bacterium]|nr:septum formation initiator family protein [Acidiferrobacterales bacterium]